MSIETKPPISLGGLVGRMAIVAVVAILALVPTFGFSFYLCGAFGALVWLRLEKPPLDKIKKRAVLAGAVTGLWVMLILLVGILLATPAENRLYWLAMAGIGLLVITGLSALSGLIGAKMYRSSVEKKPEPLPAQRPTSTIWQPASPGVSKPIVETAAAPQVIDLRDPEAGELVTISDPESYDNDLIQLALEKDSTFKVFILRHALDVMLMEAKVNLYKNVHGITATCIQYATSDQENEHSLRNAQPLVFIPRDVLLNRPVKFWLPQGFSRAKFILLNQNHDALRVVIKEECPPQFSLHVAPG